MLEARNVPTVVFANDVFVPIAYGTGEIVGFSREHVDRNVVFFPHPTSNLTRAQIFALVDARVESIVQALLGTRPLAVVSDLARPHEDDLASLRLLLEPLRSSLREDGAVLSLEGLRDGVLRARLDVDDAACADGTCVLPRTTLVAVMEATVRERFRDLRIVLDDSRERVALGQ